MMGLLFYVLTSNHPLRGSNNITTRIRVGFFLPMNPLFPDIFIQIKQQCYKERFDNPMERVKYFSNNDQHRIMSRGTMKYQIRSLLIFLIPFTFQLNTSTAQTPLNGFLNIPFGTKMETAKKLLLQKSGVKFIRQSDNHNLYFTGFSMGAYNADTCILMESQPNGRFESSTIVFYSKIELLDELYRSFRTQYGTPIKIHSEENEISYRWEFPVKGSKYSNSITLQNVSAADYFLLRYSGMGMLNPGWLEYCAKKTKNNAKEF